MVGRQQVEQMQGIQRTWLGKFGERWFGTLCTAAYLTPLMPDPDVHRTDVYVASGSGEVLRVQVKTTENPQLHADGYSYPLDVPTYDELRQGRSPGFLALVVLHRPYPCWTVHYRAGSVVRTSGYWAKLDGLPETANTSSVTITLPRANILTPASIQELFRLGGDSDGVTG